MNLLFFQSPHYSLAIKKHKEERVRDARYAYPVQPISLQDPGEPSPLPIGSFTTFPSFSSHYHRSSRSPSFELGPIPRVTPIHRSHVLVDWSLLQGVRCCTVSQTAVAKKMVCTCFLHPDGPPHTRLGGCAGFLHVFLPTRIFTVARSAYDVSVLKRRCFA